MDLDFNEEQDMLREMIRSLCDDQCSLEIVRKMEDDPKGFDSDFWKSLSELGLLGLTLPEKYGGGGQSMLECAIAYEEFGRALAPSPHFVGSVLCGGFIAANGSEDLRQRLLPKIVSGESILTPAWLEPDGGYGARGVQLRAMDDGERTLISGAKRHVAFASSAERLLVLARTGAADDQIEVFLVDPRQKGVTLTQQFTLASDTQYRVDFDNVPVEAKIDGSWLAWETLMLDGAIAQAAYAVGAAERALGMTVEFAKERKQFDKPLGAFQAISHYLADAATELDGARILVHQAAWARAEGKSVERLAPMAKLFACQMFRDLTAKAQQIYGGVGFTIEYDIQLYFRRAKQLQLSWYDGHHLEELVARAVLDSDAA